MNGLPQLDLAGGRKLVNVFCVGRSRLFPALLSRLVVRCLPLNVSRATLDDGLPFRRSDIGPSIRAVPTVMMSLMPRMVIEVVAFEDGAVGDVTDVGSFCRLRGHDCCFLTVYGVLSSSLVGTPFILALPSGCLGERCGCHPEIACAPFVLRTFPPRAGATLLPRRCFLRIAALLSGARAPPAGRFASRVLPLGAWASRRGRLHIALRIALCPLCPIGHFAKRDGTSGMGCC